MIPINWAEIAVRSLRKQAAHQSDETRHLPMFNSSAITLCIVASVRLVSCPLFLTERECLIALVARQSWLREVAHRLHRDWYRNGDSFRRGVSALCAVAHLRSWTHSQT